MFGISLSHTHARTVTNYPVQSWGICYHPIYSTSNSPTTTKTQHTITNKTAQLPYPPSPSPREVSKCCCCCHVWWWSWTGHDELMMKSTIFPLETVTSITEGACQLSLYSFPNPTYIACAMLPANLFFLFFLSLCDVAPVFLSTVMFYTRMSNCVNDDDDSVTNDSWSYCTCKSLWRQQN